MSAAPRFGQRLASVSSEQLAKFGSETPGISLAVLSTTDGFEVASYRADHAVSAKIAAMGSSLQALSEAITREAGLKIGRKLIIESDDGCVLAIGLAEIKPAMSRHSSRQVGFARPPAVVGKDLLQLSQPSSQRHMNLIRDHRTHPAGRVREGCAIQSRYKSWQVSTIV